MNSYGSSLQYSVLSLVFLLIKKNWTDTEKNNYNFKNIIYRPTKCKNVLLRDLTWQIILLSSTTR